MKVLVTGAGGYTGSRLVARLCAEGHSVRALVRRPADARRLRALEAPETGVPGTRVPGTRLPGTRVRVVIGDVIERASLAGIAAGVEVVYHLAATGRPQGPGGAGRMERVLVEGTRNLLDACRSAEAGEGRGSASGCLRAFIFTGNAAVYGDGGGALLDEGSPCRPTFPLGRAHLGAEQELERACEQGMPVTMLRLGAIYGPGRLSSELVRSGRFRVIGDGRNVSSRIHIDDVLTVLMRLGVAPLPGRYCLADEEPCAVGEYYCHLATLLGVPPPPRVPAWYARTRGWARGGVARLRGRAPYVDASVIGLFTADLRLDGGRLRAALGLRLGYPSYREGLPAALAVEGALPRPSTLPV